MKQVRRSKQTPRNKKHLLLPNFIKIHHSSRTKTANKIPNVLCFSYKRRFSFYLISLLILMQLNLLTIYLINPVHTAFLPLCLGHHLP